MTRCCICHRPVGPDGVRQGDTVAHPDCYDNKTAMPHPDRLPEPEIEAPLSLRNPQVL